MNSMCSINYFLAFCSLVIVPYRAALAAWCRSRSRPSRASGPCRPPAGSDSALGRTGCGAYLRHPLLLGLGHTSSRYPAIRMMETTQHWEGDDEAATLNRASGCVVGFWNTPLVALVRPPAIELPDVCAENAP